MTDTDQAAEQSVMERLTGHMSNLTGISDQARDEVPQSQEPQEASTGLEDVEWEGEKYQLPAKIKDALMKNADYTQKTQALSEQRKQIDHLAETFKRGEIEKAFSQSVAEESKRLSVIEAYLDQASKMNWSQMKTEDMLKAKIEIDSIKEQRDALKQAIAEKRGKFDTEVKTFEASIRAKARELAAKTISGYSEDTEQAVRKYASKDLSEAEVDRIFMDPRATQYVWKAMKYDEISAGVKPAQQQVEKALKPSGASNPMPQDVRAKLDFRKDMKAAKTSGQKAQLIEQRLAGKFGG